MKWEGCKHEIWEMESACADGQCPLCLAAQNSLLREDAAGSAGIIGGYEKEVSQLRLALKQIANGYVKNEMIETARKALLSR